MTVKMHKMWDSVFDELKIRFPNIYERAVHWYPVGRNHIVIKTTDMLEYIYDWENKQVYTKKVYLPDEDDIDECIWREQFGKKLRNMMHFKGIPLYELSKRTRISEVSLSKYINGKATPSGSNIDRIARALSCTSLELTNFDY